VRRRAARAGPRWTHRGNADRMRLDANPEAAGVSGANPTCPGRRTGKGC
jgi:hypothetical protein